MIEITTHLSAVELTGILAAVTALIRTVTVSIVKLRGDKNK